MISRYGSYDIITAHVTFKPGATLDPRYGYFTILREPVDRALSWLYFASHDVVETGQIRNQLDAARKFLRNEGDFWSPLLDVVLRDPYTSHFSQMANVASKAGSNSMKVDLALSVLSRYNLVGIYDSLEIFIDDLCSVLSVPRKPLPIVNATTSRLKVDEISERLRTRLEELTSVDIELYRAAKLLASQKRKSDQTSSGTTIILDHANKDLGPKRNPIQRSLQTGICVFPKTQSKSCLLRWDIVMMFAI